MPPTTTPAPAAKWQFAPRFKRHAFGWRSDTALLRQLGRVDEAYQRYGLLAHESTTHLTTFRALHKHYPHIPKADLLADLVRAQPGQEGKWFAAAKDAAMYAEALALCRQSPTDPRTLTRAARDFCRREPDFAVQAGLQALRWMAAGHGYEITLLDVQEADEAVEAALPHSTFDQAQVAQEVRALVKPMLHRWAARRR
jgi:hypothetical protein